MARRKLADQPPSDVRLRPLPHDVPAPPDAPLVSRAHRPVRPRRKARARPEAVARWSHARWARAAPSRARPRPFASCGSHHGCFSAPLPAWRNAKTAPDACRRVPRPACWTAWYRQAEMGSPQILERQPKWEPQRRQVPGHVRRRPASVVAGERHARRRRTTWGGWRELIWDQEVAGSNPAIPTGSSYFSRLQTTGEGHCVIAWCRLTCLNDRERWRTVQSTVP